MHYWKLKQEYLIHLNNNITCYNVVTNRVKLYNYTIPNKGSQVTDLPTSTFKDLRYREIDMINGYNYTKLKV